MSQTNSALMSIITQYTKQFVDKISELEKENTQLKQQVGTVPSTLKADFDRLTERHTELKSSYGEIERENAQLRQDITQLIAQQKSLEADISQYFAQAFSSIQTKQNQSEHANANTNSNYNYSTPSKSNMSTHTSEFPQAAPSQKPAHANAKAKATTKLLNTAYESDSECDSSDSEGECAHSRKLRFSDEFARNLNKSFAAQNTNANTTTNTTSSGNHSLDNSNTLNLSGILPNDQDDSDDDGPNDYESILKHIITEGLMSGLENMNKSPHANSVKSSGKTQENSRMFNSGHPNRFSKSNQTQTSKPQANPPASTNTNNTKQTHAHAHAHANPFGFMFNPASENSQRGQNSTPSAQEVQLVQKILESLFNPQGK